MSDKSLNHVYRLVWNEVQGCLVPVAEHASGRKKKSSGGASAAATVLVSSLLIAGGALPAFAQSLPQNAQVTAGSVKISVDGKQMSITQRSDKAAIDWSSFNVGKANSVTFIQPSADSVALNRVLGSQVSVVQGASMPMAKSSW